MIYRLEQGTLHQFPFLTVDDSKPISGGGKNGAPSWADFMKQIEEEDAKEGGATAAAGEQSAGSVPKPKATKAPVKKSAEPKEVDPEEEEKKRQRKEQEEKRRKEMKDLM